MTVKTKTRPATAADVRNYFGKNAPQSIRARVLDIDGVIVGIGGYFLSAGKAVVFSDQIEGIPKLTIWRESLAMMERLTIPAICVADDGSGPFLRRLGWEYVGNSDDGEVYKWQPY